MRIYKVGGAVRDRLMQRPAKDSDYVVIGSDEKEFLAAFPKARAVGKKKAVYILQGNEYTLSHSKNIEDDLSLRDLTINALAENEDGSVISYPGALNDIRDRILRPVMDKNFFEDPLRVFRAARFASEMPDFKVSDGLVRIMIKTAEKDLLKDLTPERIGNEVLKAFASPKPSVFLTLLRDTNCLTPWLKELTIFDEIPAGPKPFHSSSLLGHTCEVMDKLAGDPLLVWMAFCHDLGKSLTEKDHLPHHYGHEKKGVELAENLALRLKLPKAYLRAGKSASFWHMKAGKYDELRPGTRVDMLMALQREGLFDEIFKLSEADRQSSNYEKAKKDLGRILKTRLPEEFMNMGDKSASKLRELRCQAISG